MCFIHHKVLFPSDKQGHRSLQKCWQVEETNCVLARFLLPTNLPFPCGALSLKAGLDTTHQPLLCKIEKTAVLHGFPKQKYLSDCSYVKAVDDMIEYLPRFSWAFTCFVLSKDMYTWTSLIIYWRLLWSGGSIKAGRRYY